MSLKHGLKGLHYVLPLGVNVFNTLALEVPLLIVHWRAHTHTKEPVLSP